MPSLYTAPPSFAVFEVKVELIIVAEPVLSLYIAPPWVVAEFVIKVDFEIPISPALYTAPPSSAVFEVNLDEFRPPVTLPFLSLIRISPVLYIAPPAMRASLCLQILPIRSKIVYDVKLPPIENH